MLKKLETKKKKKNKKAIMKPIKIDGLCNRYWIKKLTSDDKEKQLKQNPNVCVPIEYTEEAQRSYIRMYPESIEKKISNYKQQDKAKAKVKKLLIDDEMFVKTPMVQQMLEDCLLKCYYCKELMFVIYDIRREMKQWTLDRIDNNLGHTIDNVVISCLSCNLKKRSRNHDNFCFSSNLTITKL